MAEFLRLTGMPEAIANTVTEEIRFVLTVSDGEPVMCTARLGVATQIASGLGNAAKVLQGALSARQAWEPFAPEQITDIQITKNPLTDQVVLHLTTVQGIPHVLQMSPKNARDIATLLRKAAEGDPLASG